MASKTRVTRLESEIEKCRADANWPKVLDLARQISTKTPSLDTYAGFVVAESKLERFLLENPPSEKNIAKAQEELESPERQLNDVLHSKPDSGIKLEAELLLAKIHYAVGDYKAALTKYDTIGLDNLSVKSVSNRRLKLIGEAFAVKGLCLERTPPSSSSKFRVAEKEEAIIKCFERSGDISLAQLQEKHEKVTKGSATAVTLHTGGLWNLVDTDTTGVGPIVETAIQRSPILYIRNGELSKGVGRFRDLLRAVETRAIQGLRQTLARQLAEVLLRGVCNTTYEPVPIENGGPQSSDVKTPKHYAGDSLFKPQNQFEESLLLLLISESIATREAILNRSSELSEARLHTFHNTTAVYDLLTIALVKRAQFNMLSETFERAMKFSFDEFHIWYQFALSLICAEKYGRALLVLKECLRLKPKDPVVLLQAAKICYEQRKMDEGLEYSKTCAELDDNPLISKAYVSLGVGYSMKAEEAKLQVQRQEYQKKSLDLYLRATSLDSNDHLAQYHVALELAQLRQIPEAMKHVQKALRLRSDHVHSLHLLALLLSAQKHYSEALELIDAAVAEYPENFCLLFTKSKLEEVVYGSEEALQTCRTMMMVWKQLFEPTLDSEHRGTGLLNRIASSHRSLVQLQLTEFSDRGSGSIRGAESLAASRVEQALSEVASSLGSSMIPRQGPQQTWMVQTQIWLHLAEMYLNLGKLESAQLCIQEAGTIYPFSHMVSYTRGCLHELRGELNDAKQCFENAISINPVHIRSLQQLGLVLHKLGNDRMAEKVLRDAVNADPTSSQSWNHLGKVLQSLEDFDAGAECLMTSVELEATNPIVPFTNLARQI